MNVLDGFFRNAQRLQIYDAFTVDKFSRACAYYKIVCVITSSENWSIKNLNNFWNRLTFLNKHLLFLEFWKIFPGVVCEEI